MDQEIDEVAKIGKTIKNQKLFCLKWLPYQTFIVLVMGHFK